MAAAVNGLDEHPLLLVVGTSPAASRKPAAAGHCTDPHPPAVAQYLCDSVAGAALQQRTECLAWQARSISVLVSCSVRRKRICCTGPAPDVDDSELTLDNKLLHSARAGRSGYT